MSNPSFVHLNVHSHFSLLDSTIRINELVLKAKELQMPALALTDNGVLYGALDFYKICHKNGIKPILGCEMYVSPQGMNHRLGISLDEETQRLSLIASNNKGWQNLLKLVSESHIKGFYYKPRIDHYILEKYSEGLIAMSSGMDGEIPHKLINGDYAGAKQLAQWYRDRFDFYLELQNHHIPIQNKINRELVKLGQELKIPVIATNDVHYLSREDSILHEIILCINDGKTIEDTSRYRYPGGPDYYLKSAEEMHELFCDIPEAISNTLELAEKCHVIIETNKYHLPIYDVPVGHDEVSYLRECTWKGIRWRYGELTHEIRERTEFELRVIERMGFCSYFLIVWDFMNYAREHGIAVGPGHGAAAGSIVSYALRITDIDPLRYALLFERFLNPDHISMPDIDIDFCADRLEEVIQYVTLKYGADKVAQIQTVGILASKMAFKVVARTLDFESTEVDRLSKMISTKPGVKLNDFIGEGSELYAEMKKNPELEKLIGYALRLEGLAHKVGIHAAGVVIGREPLDRFVPLRSENGKLITQFTKDEVEEVGLLKLDFLSLRNLTIISQTLELIKLSHGQDIDISKIPVDNQKTYDLLCSGYITGVFQLEFEDMCKRLRRLMPGNIEDITALLSLSRSGTLGSGMDVDFVERKLGCQPLTYTHPKIENLLYPILKDTYGLILYQEQIMQISRTVAGFTHGEADVLLKAMGKKQTDILLNMKAKFVDGAEHNGIPSDKSEELFTVMEKFAKYSSNKSHSVSYAMIAYQSAYLKANYPVEYMAALISSVMSTQDKMFFYVAEARHMNIGILPPDINESLNSFTVKDQNIRFGLGGVKGLDEGAIENIISDRFTNGPYTSLFNFCSRANLRLVNKRVIEILIRCGAFGSLHPNRRQLIENLDTITSIVHTSTKNKTDPDNLSELAPCEEYNLEELLNFEKEKLGDSFC